MCDKPPEQENEYYFASNGKRGGPVSLLELKKMAECRTIRREDKVWRHGMPAWGSIVDVLPEVFEEVPPDLDKDVTALWKNSKDLALKQTLVEANMHMEAGAFGRVLEITRNFKNKFGIDKSMEELRGKAHSRLVAVIAFDLNELVEHRKFTGVKNQLECLTEHVDKGEFSGFLKTAEDAIRLSDAKISEGKNHLETHSYPEAAALFREARAICRDNPRVEEPLQSALGAWRTQQRRPYAFAAAVLLWTLIGGYIGLQLWIKLEINQRWRRDQAAWAEAKTSAAAADAFAWQAAAEKLSSASHDEEREEICNRYLNSFPSGVGTNAAHTELNLIQERRLKAKAELEAAETLRRRAAAELEDRRAREAEQKRIEQERQREAELALKRESLAREREASERLMYYMTTQLSLKSSYKFSLSPWTKNVAASDLTAEAKPPSASADLLNRSDWNALAKYFDIVSLDSNNAVDALRSALLSERTRGEIVWKKTAVFRKQQGDTLSLSIPMPEQIVVSVREPKDDRLINVQKDEPGGRWIIDMPAFYESAPAFSVLIDGIPSVGRVDVSLSQLDPSSREVRSLNDLVRNLGNIATNPSHNRKYSAQDASTVGDFDQLMKEYPGIRLATPIGVNPRTDNNDTLTGVDSSYAVVVLKTFSPADLQAYLKQKSRKPGIMSVRFLPYE